MGIAGVNFAELSQNIDSLINKDSFKTIVIGLDLTEFATKHKNNFSQYKNKFLQNYDEKFFNFLIKISEKIYGQSFIEDENIYAMQAPANEIGQRLFTQVVERSSHRRLINSDWKQYESQMQMLDSVLATACKKISKPNYSFLQFMLARFWLSQHQEILNDY